MDRAEQLQEAPPELIEKEEHTTLFLTPGIQTYEVPNATSIVSVRLAWIRELDVTLMVMEDFPVELDQPTNPIEYSFTPMPSLLPDYSHLSEPQELVTGGYGRVMYFDFSALDPSREGEPVTLNYRTLIPIEVTFNEETQEFTIPDEYLIAGTQMDVIYMTKVQDLVNRDA